MADKLGNLEQGVKSQIVTWHLADGTPTDDKSKAATAEVVTTYDDGSSDRRIMNRPGSQPNV